MAVPNGPGSLRDRLVPDCSNILGDGARCRCENVPQVKSGSEP
jgi:hypothetical protein